MSVDAGPGGIEVDEVVELMMKQEGVMDVHHVHIWSISTTETALTAHVVIADCQQLDKTTHQLKEMLEKEGIAHSTLEMETPLSHCHSHDC